jgi:NAD+ kinase
MKVGIYGKKFDKLNENAVVELITKLQQSNIEISVNESFYELIKEKIALSKEITTFSASRHIVDKINFLFSLGGDGTLLETLSLVKGSGIPILGINTGRLGFLSSISEREIGFAVDSLCTDN